MKNSHTFDLLKAHAIARLKERPTTNNDAFDHCILVAFNREVSTKLGLAFEEDEVALAKPNMEIADGEAWWIVFSMRNGIFTWVPADACEKFQDKVYAFHYRAPKDESEDPEYALLRNGVDTGISVQDCGGEFIVVEERGSELLFHAETFTSREDAFAAAQAVHTVRLN